MTDLFSWLQLSLPFVLSIECWPLPQWLLRLTLSKIKLIVVFPNKAAPALQCPACAGGNPFWALLALLTLFLALHSQSGVMSFLLHPSFLCFCSYYLYLNAALMPPSQSIVVASNEFP